MLYQTNIIFSKKKCGLYIVDMIIFFCTVFKKILYFNYFIIFLL